MKANRYFSDQYEGDGVPNLRVYADAGHVLYAAKASEGTGHVDQRHKERTEYAHKQGLTVLHYHYCRPDQNNPGAEMKLFWEAARQTYQDGDFLALDFESAFKHLGVLADQNYIAACWLKLRGFSGHTGIVYGSTSFLEVNTGRNWLRFKRRWQAQYGTGPGRAPWGTAWWAWQMTDGKVGPEPHKLPGMPQGDISVLNLRTAVRLSVRTARRRRRIQH